MTELEKKLLSEKESEHKDLGNSQPVCTTQKNENMCSEESQKAVADQVTELVHLPSPQENCHFELKGMETGQKEGRLLELYRTGLYS